MHGRDRAHQGRADQQGPAPPRVRDRAEDQLTHHEADDVGGEGELHSGLARAEVGGELGERGQAAPVVDVALAAFHHRHPAVEIVISDTGSRHMAEQVRAGDLDLAFVGLLAGQVPADLVHRILADEPLVAVVSRPPSPQGATADLAALAAEHAFVEMRPESGLRRQVDAAFARAGVERRVAFELSTSDAVVRFVDLGFGPAILPRSAIVPRSAAADDLDVLPLADGAARHPIALVHRAPAPSAPSARALLDLLAAREVTVRAEMLKNWP